MRYLISDLHIHSRFSRATSKYLTFPNLYKWALIKGVYLLGTGDILHPKWLEEAKEYLVYDQNTGFYSLKPEIAQALAPEIPSKVRGNTMFFVPSVETSHIYKQDDKLRRIHLVFVLSDLEKAKKLSDKMATFSTVAADGRPIFGVNARDMTEIVLEIDPNAIVIPAHIWTPHFSLFGSKSGFDDIKQAFKDMTPYVTCLETGLSSDPKMNRLVPDLDKYILCSNSDSHSLERIGREANLHTQLDSYTMLKSALKTGEGLYGTIEFYPQEGKYHYDGHRNCQVSFHPQESQKHNNICPKCNKPLTIGVLNRVYQLAKGNTQLNSKLLEKYKSIYIIPLEDILASLLGTGRTSKRVKRAYFDAIETLGSELDILTTIEPKTIAKYDPLLARAIELLRQDQIVVEPGYDGEYGKIRIPKEKLEQPSSSQGSQLSLL